MLDERKLDVFHVMKTPISINARRL